MVTIKPRTLYSIIVCVIVLLFATGIFLLVNSNHTSLTSSSIPTDSKFITISPLSINPPAKTLPKLYNTPPEVNWTQTLKIRKFLDQFREDNNITTELTAYYREGSLRMNSRGAAILIDMPAIKQTISIEVNQDDTLGISCALQADQKEPTWSCSDDTLGESE